MTSAERAKELLYRMSAEAWIPDDTHVDWERRVSQAIDAAVAEALPRWVPVTERLPVGEIVLACTSDGEIFMGEWREHDTDPGGAWWSDDDEIVRVVAWQPLPAPWVAP